MDEVKVTVHLGLEAVDEIRPHREYDFSYRACAVFDMCSDPVFLEIY